MGSGSAYCSLLFSALLVLQCALGSHAREMARRHQQKPEDGHHLKMYAVQDERDDHPSSHMDHIDPELHVFLNINDLYIGKNMPIYFDIIDPSTTPHLLPREEADSIPFSSSQLDYLLKFFSFSEDSSQAKAISDTLKQCEFESSHGETKFCATSLESMLDSTRGILGPKFDVLTTNITRFSSSKISLLQNYTFLEVPKEITSPMMVACHTMPYPYAVFYCHGEESKNKLFKALLGGENGDRVEALVICHMDSSQWDHDHVAFQLLGTQPGGSPVCHFFPTNHLVWVPSRSS